MVRRASQYVPVDNGGGGRLVALLGVAGDLRVVAGLLVGALIANALVLPPAGTFTLALVVGTVLVVAARKPELGVVFIVVSVLVIPGYFAVGGFSLIMAAGLVGFGLWFSGRCVNGPPRHVRFGALDAVLYCVVMAHVVSYTVGAYHFRPADGVLRADAELVLMVAFMGITLFIREVIQGERQLYWLVNLLLLGISVGAVVVIAEFLAGRELTSFLRPPGFSLTEGPSDQLLPQRFGVDRRSGIAQNPIEFSAVMAAALPLAVGQWLVAPTLAMRRVGALTAVLIVASVPFAVSRTGIAGLLFAGFATLVVLDRDLRGKVLRGLGVLALVGLVVMPTSISLLAQVTLNFSNAEESLDTTGRSGDYGVVRAMVAERPVLGLGAGRFSPAEARLVEGRRVSTLWLDNDYLLAIVDGGIVGLAALVALPVVGVCICWASRRRTAHRPLAVLGGCCMVAVLTSALTWAFFDASGFRMNQGMFFSLLAIAGALDNITRVEQGSGRRNVSVASLPPTQLGG